MEFGQKFILINEAPYNCLEGHTTIATKFIMIKLCLNGQTDPYLYFIKENKK